MLEQITDIINLVNEGALSYPITEGVVVCIPAYNEGNSISDVISHTQKYISQIIVCDDGSIDNTSNLIRDSGSILIKNNDKMGKGYTLRALFREAVKLDPDVIITLDGDNQHDPLDLPVFLNEVAKNDCDIVVGSRFVAGSNTDISRLRLFGLTVINTLQRILTGCAVKDSQSGFRAFTRKAFPVVLESKENGYSIESEQLFIAGSKGLRVKEVPITIRYKGLHSTSKKHFMLHGLELILYIVKYAYNNSFTKLM